MSGCVLKKFSHKHDPVVFLAIEGFKGPWPGTPLCISNQAGIFCDITLLLATSSVLQVLNEIPSSMLSCFWNGDSYTRWVRAQLPDSLKPLRTEITGKTKSVAPHPPAYFIYFSRQNEIWSCWQLYLWSPDLSTRLGEQRTEGSVQRENSLLPD